MRLQSKIASKIDQLDPIKLDGSKLTDKDIKWWHSYRSLIDYATKKLAHQDENDRIAIEGKFGLGRIMTKLDHTSKTAIVISFLVMSLEKWLKAIFLSLFRLRYHLKWAPLSKVSLHAY